MEVLVELYAKVVNSFFFLRTECVSVLKLPDRYGELRYHVKGAGTLGIQRTVSDGVREGFWGEVGLGQHLKRCKVF